MAAVDIPDELEAAVSDDDHASPGDPVGALEALYRAEHAASVRLAHLLVGDRARAEELAHDAFVRVFGRIGSIDDPPAYLRTTLVNLCRDHGRRRTRTDALPVPRGEDHPEPPLPPDGSPVWAALQGLPHRQRAALALRYYLDRPTEEIAETLGVRPATVRSLLHRGLTTLKEVVPRD